MYIYNFFFLIGVFLEDIMANRSAAEWLYKYGGFDIDPSQYVDQGDSSSENFKVLHTCISTCVFV